MSLINIDEWASDNNIDTPKRLVNSIGGIHDYTQVFEDILENNPINVTIELTPGKKYGYSKTFEFHLIIPQFSFPPNLNLRDLFYQNPMK